MAVALNPPSGAGSDRNIFEGWVMGTSVVGAVATLLYGITFATLFLGLMGLASYSIHGKQQAGVIRIVAYAAAAAILVAHFILFALDIAAVVFLYQAALDSDSVQSFTTRYSKTDDLAEAGNKTAWAVNLLMLLASIFALGRGIHVHYSDKIQNKFVSSTCNNQWKIRKASQANASQTSRLVLLTSFLLVMFAAYTFGFFAYEINPASGRASAEAFYNGSQVLAYVLKVILSEIPLFGGLWAVYYAGKGAFKTEHIPKAPRNAAVVKTEQTKTDDTASSVPEAASQV